MNEQVMPLSGRGTPVSFRRANDGYLVRWGATQFTLSDVLIETICSAFFRDPESWYVLGSSADMPIPGGLGEFVASHGQGLTPRHASAIAPILDHLGLVQWRGKKPVYLRKRRDL